MPLGVGALTLEQAHTVKHISPTRGIATIEVSGKVTKAAAGSSSGGVLPAVVGDALKIETGSISGQFNWDFRAGRLASGETTLDLTAGLDTPLGRMKLMQKMSSSIRFVDKKAER